MLSFQLRKLVRSVHTITTFPKNILVQHDLTKYFKDKISISGPITVAEYMRESLKMYYNSRKVFGSDGDFITSPEISQLYGEVSKLHY
jgi:NADH dehydrogenase [ubiquinone] 1 alpha subcomplex assembly factor 7